MAEPLVLGPSRLEIEIVIAKLKKYKSPGSDENPADMIQAGGEILLSAIQKKKEKLHGRSPRANYTDRATAACRRSDCQLLRIEGATWSARRIPTALFSIFWTGAATFLSSSSCLRSTNSLILFGIWKNYLISGRSLLLYQFTKRVTKLTVIIIVGYHCYQLHTTFYRISFKSKYR
jgi:hypothetical protein